MLLSKLIDKVDIGDEVYVVKPIQIRWNTMRFENTNIIYATYVVSDPTNNGSWGTHKTNCLEPLVLPKGTKTYPRRIFHNETEFQCFLTKEEAEVWKVIELQDIEEKVEEHIEEMRKKTLKKIKTIKQKEKLEKYFQKYPEKFLKVM